MYNTQIEECLNNVDHVRTIKMKIYNKLICFKHFLNI